MISLKRHIETEQTSAELLRAVVDAYQSALTATALSAGQACPTVEPELGRQLTALGQQLAVAETRTVVEQTNAAVTDRLQHWADEAETDRRKKTSDVRELLVTLAHTAASVAASDAEHVMQFDALTARLERIATLDDVTALRSAVMESASDLRASVEQLSKSSRSSMKQLQGELDRYQSKLEQAEQMAALDPLTGLLNRRKIEASIARRIERGQPFCIGLIDLDGFKAINDRLGHLAGDDLLRQFSADLKSNARPSDHVGRWGGDEFVVVVDGSQAQVTAHLARVEQWIVGDYALPGPNGTTKVRLDASIGVSEWQPGMNAQQLVEAADASMYQRKRSRR